MKYIVKMGDLKLRVHKMKDIWNGGYQNREYAN